MSEHSQKHGAISYANGVCRRSGAEPSTATMLNIEKKPKKTMNLLYPGDLICYDHPDQVGKHYCPNKETSFGGSSETRPLIYLLNNLVNKHKLKEFSQVLRRGATTVWGAIENLFVHLST
jgi:hypothetical protein